MHRAHSVFDELNVGMQIDFFVLQRAPQSLHEDIVNPASFTIHAEFDASFEHGFGEVPCGELGPLSSVDDLRLSESRQGLFQRFHAESRLQSVVESPG